MSKELSTKLAFIIGHYKSGSTWLSHALALHPDIVSMHEMHIFRYLKESSDYNEVVFKLFNTSSWGNKGMKSFPRSYLARSTRALRKYLRLSKGTSTLPTQQVPNRSQDLGLYNCLRVKNALLKSESDSDFLETFFTFLLEAVRPNRYLIEKTPTNIYEVDKIKLHFPGAKLISIHRDGRDVVVSDRYHVRRVYGSERTVRDSADRWNNAMTAEANAIKEYEIFQASYEKMQEDPKTLLNEILLFLELESNSTLLDEMIFKSSFKFATGGRDRGDADNKNFRRKGIVGDWVNELTDEELIVIDEVAGKSLSKFGYK